MRKCNRMGNKKVSDRGLFIGLAICLIVFCCINLQKLYGAIIVPDEAGYWATGYFMNGVSWEGIMGTSSYYGWGYGVVLALILKLTASPVIAYRIAVVLNVFFLVLCFGLAVKICEYLFPENNARFRVVVSFIVTVYSGYLYNTQTTYCETLLLLLFWVLLFLMIKIVLNSKIIYIILLGMVSSFLVAVHLRMLTCIVAVGITMLYLLIEKRICLKHIFLFVLVLSVGLISVFSVKELLTNTLYARSTLMSTNTISGQLGKSSYLFSVSGILQLLQSVLGKIMYIGTSTFLFAYSGFFVMLSTICRGLVKKNEKDILKTAFYIFVVLALSGAVALSAYSLVTFSRLDHIIYGRYTEYLIGIILLIAFNSLNACVKKKCVIITILSHMIVGLLVFTYACKLKEITKPSVYTIPGLWGILNEYSKDSVLGLTILVGIVALMIYMLFLLLHKTVNKYILLIALSLIWMLVAKNGVKYSLYNEQETTERDYLYFSEQIQPIIESEEVYYVINDTEFVSWLKFKLKFFMPKTEMIAYETNEYELIQPGDYMILYNEGKYKKEIMMTRGELIFSSKYFSLYKKA